MYITRFITTNNEKQDYYYHNIEYAENHLSLFKEDDSGLYRNICIFDDSDNTVLAILPFVNGKPQAVIRNGGIVKIKPEWSQPGEEKYRYTVSNIHEERENVCITCLNSGMMIQPSEVVGIEMIEPASEN